MNQKLHPGVVAGVIIAVLAIVVLVMFKGAGSGSHDRDIRPTEEMSAALKAGKGPMMPGAPAPAQGK